MLVIGRGDSEPIVSNAKEGHARNRRVEITVTPLPVPFHTPDPDRDKTGSGAALDPLAPPPAPPASTRKEKNSGH